MSLSLLLDALQHLGKEMVAEGIGGGSQKADQIMLRVLFVFARKRTARGIVAQIAGYLDIPAMEQRLPIYLGASMENLAKGVAVLGQTSMPIGGENTNCVIAGHRGNGSDDLFRNIQLLQPGDQVSLTNLWQTLQYTVAEIHIIQPDDLDAIRLQEGQELLTLISCHPQVGATHRYVVILTRNPEADTPQTPDDAPAVELPIVVKTTPQSPAASSECTGDAALTQAEQRNDTVVWLEKWLPLAAIPLILRRETARQQTTG